MDRRYYLTLCYALHLFLTGLWRSIEVQAFKPSAFWFCSVLGAIAIASVFLYQWRLTIIAQLFALASATMALAYYLFSFMTNAEQDASFRVAAIIISSIAILVLTFAHSPQAEKN